MAMTKVATNRHIQTRGADDVEQHNSNNEGE